MADERRGRQTSHSDTEYIIKQVTERVTERMVALETRIAYQDHLLASLDEVLREFTTRVERLERRVHELRGAVASMPDPGPANQPPPHY